MHFGRTFAKPETDPLLYTMGKTLIFIGLILVVTGLVLHFFPGLFRFIGRLPGDFHLERAGFQLHFPLATSLLLSLVLSLLFWLLRK